MDELTEVRPRIEDAVHIGKFIQRICGCAHIGWNTVSQFKADGDFDRSSALVSNNGNPTTPE